MTCGCRKGAKCAGCMDRDGLTNQQDEHPGRNPEAVQSTRGAEAS